MAFHRRLFTLAHFNFYFTYVQVAWLKNGADLNLIPGELNGRIGMTVAFGLVLTQIDYSDAGSYVCKASNINGEASNRTVVTVVGKLVIFHHLQ